MGIADRPTRPAIQPTPQMGAHRLKMLFARKLEADVQFLREIHTIVQRHGRSAISQALGPEAPQLAALYQQIRQAIDEHRPDLSPPELPPEAPQA